MDGKKCKPGRVKKNCIKCGKEFSTHSSNRVQCHVCLPKCTERHVFPKKKKEIKQVIENT